MPKDTYIQDNAGHITHSKLQDFSFCPTLYKLKYIDRVVPKRSSDALLFGSAFDLYIQDKTKFGKQYLVVGLRYDVHKKLEDVSVKMEELEGQINELKKAEAKTKAQEKRLQTKLEKKKELEAKHKELKADADKTQITTLMGGKLIDCLTELQRHPLYSFNSKNAQVSVEIEYKGYKLRGTMDNLDLENGVIDDIKTTASIDGLDRGLWAGKSAKEKYRSQLAFYQFLVQVKHDVLCEGKLSVVSKEDPPKACYFHATKESLLDFRGTILAKLDEMIEIIEMGIYPTCPREQCLKCEAYGVCPYSIQKEYVEI